MAKIWIQSQHYWKRWMHRLDKSLGIMVLLLTLLFGALILSGQVVLPLPEGEGERPGAEISVSASTWQTTELGEQMRSQFAMDTYTTSRWSAEEIPLWQPRQGFGTPHFAAAEVGALAPTRLLAILLAGGHLSAWMVAVALGSVFTGIFIYAFLRALQLPDSVAATLGVGLALHPAFLLTGWLGSLTAMMWLPFLLWQSERHLREDHAFGPVVWLVLGVAATLYSGDHVAASLVLITWLLYILARLGYRWWQLARAPESRPHLKQYGLILVLGLALAAPQLWPALVEAWHSGSIGSRWQSLQSELATVGMRPGAFDFRQFLLLWVPMRYALVWFDVPREVTQGWLTNVGLFMGIAMTALWALAWTLAPRRRQLWFWSALWLVGGLLALLLPSLAPLFLAVSALAVILCSAYGLEAICTRNLIPERWLVLSLGGMIALELSAAGLGIWPFVDQQTIEDALGREYSLEFDSGYTHVLDIESNRLTLANAEGESLASAFAAARPPVSHDLGSLDWQGIGYVRAADVESYVASGGVLGSNLEIDSERVLVRSDSAFPLLYLASHAVIFGTKEAAVLARDSGEVDLRQTVILESGGAEEPVFDPLEDTLPAPTLAVRAVSIAAERVVASVEPTAPAILVRLVEYDPHWRVKVDGVPSKLVRANGFFQAVLLSPGKHEVIFEYRSGSLLGGGFVFLLSLVILGAWWVSILRQRRHAEQAMHEHFHVV